MISWSRSGYVDSHFYTIYNDSMNKYEKNRKDKAERAGLAVSHVHKYGFDLCVKVYDKCNRQCTRCGETNRLHIHHIDGSGKTCNPNNSLDNLEIICSSCHGSMHAKQQWKEYRIRRKEAGLPEWSKEYKRQYAKEYYKKLKKDPVRLAKKRQASRDYWRRLKNDKSKEIR